MEETNLPVEGKEEKSLNFSELIVEQDLAEGKNDGRIQTRFPPTPERDYILSFIKSSPRGIIRG